MACRADLIINVEPGTVGEDAGARFGMNLDFDDLAGRAFRHGCGLRVEGIGMLTGVAAGAHRTLLRNAQARIPPAYANLLPPKKVQGRHDPE